MNGSAYPLQRFGDLPVLYLLPAGCSVNHQNPLDFEGRGHIRCVQQLGMVKLWERLTGAAELPALASVNGYDLERLRDKLMLLDVVWREGEPSYLIRFQGADFHKMHNRDCTGLFLDEVMAPAVRERGLRAYRTVVDRRIPAFTSTPVINADGATVHYERLLLPFTTAGEGVEHIHCVITLFAEDNRSPFEVMRKSGSPDA